jgi:hypothetical protein
MCSCLQREMQVQCSQWSDRIIYHMETHTMNSKYQIYLTLLLSFLFYPSILKYSKFLYKILFGWILNTFNADYILPVDQMCNKRICMTMANNVENHVNLNITKHPHLLGYYVMTTTKKLLMFQRTVVAPSSGSSSTRRQRRHYYAAKHW